MKNSLQQDITTLLNSTAIGFLASQGEHAPETSMAPYAIFEGDILLHLSTLAKHSANIAQYPAISLMICTPDKTGCSPLALPRLRFQGKVERVNQDKYEQAKTAYLAQIPDAEPLFDFTDFYLYRLSATDIFWVGGFASAQQISLKSWRKLSC